MPTHDQNLYFLTIVEDKSRTTWDYLMKNKTQVFDIIIFFIKIVKTQFNTNIKTLRSNNRLEFTSSKFNTLLKEMARFTNFLVHTLLNKIVKLRESIRIS